MDYCQPFGADNLRGERPSGIPKYLAIDFLTPEVGGFVHRI
jgi:hypothetical protein